MILAGKDDNGIWIFDCNHSGTCDVAYYYQSYSVLAQKNIGMSLYHSTRYPAPAVSFDFCDQEENMTVSGTYKFWWKQVGYGTCDVNLDINGSALGTIYPDSNGYFSYEGDTYCLSCGTKIADGAVIPAGHKLTEVAGVDATCVDTGTVAHWYCSVCDKNFADETAVTELTDVAIPIDASNHVGDTEKRNSVEATCTIPGHEGDTYCLDCGTKHKDGAIIPAGHSLTEVAGIAATATDIFSVKIVIFMIAASRTGILSIIHIQKMIKKSIYTLDSRLARES